MRVSEQAHDVYIWNGIEALALTKAVALTKCIELERFFLADNHGAVHHLHATASAPPLWAGAEAPLAQSNHLLSLLTTHTATFTLPCSALLSARIPGLSPPNALLPAAPPAVAQRHCVTAAAGSAGLDTAVTVLGAGVTLPLLATGTSKLIFDGCAARSLQSPRGELAAATGVTQLPEHGAAEAALKLQLGAAKMEKIRIHGQRSADPHESRAEKLRHFDALCSEIEPRLYLGSETVARQLHMLRAHGVTHVLNTAGLLCKNFHSAVLEYKTLHLYDAPTQASTKPPPSLQPPPLPGRREAYLLSPLLIPTPQALHRALSARSSSLRPILSTPGHQYRLLRGDCFH